MIYTISGKIILIKNDFIVLENNNIGYKIFVGSLLLELKLGQEIFLYTYQSVKENSLELFGFRKNEELSLFELLISISGIGPRVAMGILSVSTPSSLKRAVISENFDELTKVSGIGPKVAKKIILELSNKVNKIEISNEQESDFDLEVYETLEALGFSRVDIRGVLPEIKSKNIEDKIKEALKILSAQKKKV